MGAGEQAAAALRNKMRRFRERGEIPEAVGYGLPAALIVLALLWPFLYGVVPSRAVWKSTSASGFIGDDPADLARSSGEEPASPRHRAGVASMAWRTNAP